MNSLNTYIDIQGLGETLGYILISFVIFFIGKFIYKLLQPKINITHELVEKDNFAFILSYVGYFSGLLIILGAAIVGESHGFMNDIILISIYGISGIILLHASIWISNKVLLNKFDLKKEIITDQNQGTGIIEAVIYIGNALILYGAIIGESTTLLEGMITFVAYWAIGNIALILAAKVFVMWNSYDIHKEIERDNVAAGLSFAGAILAISIIVMNALIAPFIDWATTLTDVLIQTVIGCLLLPIMRYLSDTVLLPGRKLTDEIVHQEKPNVGAGLIEAFAYVGSAILITWSL